MSVNPPLGGDRFGDLMNAPRKYLVSRTLERPTWRDTTIIRENVVEVVRALKAQPGGLPEGMHATFELKSATPYPTGVVGLHYARRRDGA